MKKLELRDKDRQILKLIVESYLKIGQPISSGLLVQEYKLPYSTATIRNVMVKLEDYGFLSQPHTSAGRLPTDKGLRYFVNSLLAETLFPQTAVDFFAADFSSRGDLNSLLLQASKILADYSGNLGFVLSPRISRVNFHHLRFIKIAENKVMTILVTPFNLVLTEIVQTSAYFTQVELEKASEYINQNFRGKSLSVVRDYLWKELPEHKLRYETTLNKLILLLRSSLLQEEKDAHLLLQGTSKLLEKAELFDMSRLKALFQNFEEKAKLEKLLSDFISLDRVKVLIGSEAQDPDISDCSLILSHYGSENQVLGSLGIIGPKRIPYEQIIPLVDIVAQKLSQAIRHNT
jgi:heat-inducible transcriptional repressor